MYLDNVTQCTHTCKCYVEREVGVECMGTPKVPMGLYYQSYVCLAELTLIHAENIEGRLATYTLEQ
eukprot:2748279-Karenia_brevis.AAC.1